MKGGQKMKGMNHRKVLNLSCVTETDAAILERLIDRAVRNRRSVSAEAFTALEFFERNAPSIMLGEPDAAGEKVDNGK